MKKGDIVLVDFYFTDFSNFKQRPALIVSSNQSNEADVMVAFITSVISLPIHPTHLLVSTDNIEFASTGLKANSMIKCDKLMTVNKKLIVGKIGEISLDMIKKIDDKLLIALDIKQ
jgi:mRNA interferase MazF